MAKKKQKGGANNLEFINKRILQFLGITPIINVVFYLLFIIFSFIVIIELIWKKNASDIKWYSGYTHFFIKLLIVILFLPQIPILINIFIGIIKSFLPRKKTSVGANEQAPHDGSSTGNLRSTANNDGERYMRAFDIEGGTTYHGGNGNSDEEYMNVGFFKIIIDSFKLILIDSFHTFITFFLVISYFSLVEHTDYFKNFLNFVNFIFFTLIFLYALTILFKINNETKQENILGFIILLVLLNFIFNPLFFILTKTIEWAKNSNHFFVNLIILILYSLAGIGINKIRWELNNSIQELNQLFYNVLSDVQKFSKSNDAQRFDKKLNDFLNVAF